MKNTDDYTIEDIDKIWSDMQPGSVTKAYTLMKLKCEQLEKVVNENCNLACVTNRRELLIGFAEWWDKRHFEDGDSITDDEVDEYLANL
jgi:hypothetical protein